MAAAEDFTLGEHNAAIRQLLRDQRQMREDLAEIRVILAERRGERRATLWFVSTTGALIGAAVAFTVRFLIGRTMGINA